MSYTAMVDLEFDKNHIWHPYTSTVKPLPCYPIISAHGVLLELENGSKLIDGMSSWWAAIHGYNNSFINEALKNQIESVSHVMFGGITHQPAVSLCKKLVAMLPQSLDTVFLSDSGSVAVEVALKMALQYWHSKGENRTKFMTVRNGYHGDTFAAMAVTDPENSMHSLYRGYLQEHIFAIAPQSALDDERDDNAVDIIDFEQKLAKHQSDIAAVIIEPIIQGAGGMRVYRPEYLKKLRQLCTDYDVLFIADEIATGFGRTGKLFACEHADVIPDIICLGKALTGGYVSLAATVTSKKIADIISSGSSGCFMHGPTFMANPLACSAANASLELIQRNTWQEQVLAIENQLKLELLPLLTKYSLIKDIRVLGAIGIVELYNHIDVAKLQKQFVEQGVWIRPFGKLIYIMPPYIINVGQLSSLIRAIDLVVKDL